MSTEFEYPSDVTFGCIRCGRCCGDTENTVRHVLLLKTEAERISKETTREISEFAKEVFGSEPYIYEIIKTESDGKCFFLEGNHCTIYDLRPIICRFYPFELKNLGNDRFSFSYTTKCEGIGQGSKVEKLFFDNLFRIASKAMDEDSKSD